MSHGGRDNGRLPVTYRNFEDWGIRSDSIASAVREVVALGFVEVTRRGYGGAAEMRTPSLYRLTYFPAWNAGKKDTSGTHEYLRIATDAEADAVAKAARKRADVRNVERGKKQNATPQNVSISPPETWGETQNSRRTKRGVQAHPTKRDAQGQDCRLVENVDRERSACRCRGRRRTAQKAQFRRSRVGGRVTFCATCPTLPRSTFTGGANADDIMWSVCRRAAANRQR